MGHFCVTDSQTHSNRRKDFYGDLRRLKYNCHEGKCKMTPPPLQLSTKEYLCISLSHYILTERWIVRNLLFQPGSLNNPMWSYFLLFRIAWQPGKHTICHLYWTWYKVSDNTRFFLNNPKNKQPGWNLPKTKQPDKQLSRLRYWWKG